MQERLAAEVVLAAFCRDNSAGQAQLASTLAPSSKSGVAAFNIAIGCIHATLSLCRRPPPLLLALSSTLVVHCGGRSILRGRTALSTRPG